MNPSVLFLVTSDPRASGRPAEAVRIAAGLGAWKKISVSLYLREAATLILQPGAERLIDEDNFERYLPLLLEGGRPIYVWKDAPLSRGCAWPLEKISDAQLAVMAAAKNHVLRF